MGIDPSEVCAQRMQTLRSVELTITEVSSTSMPSQVHIAHVNDTTLCSVIRPNKLVFLHHYLFLSLWLVLVCIRILVWFDDNVLFEGIIFCELDAAIWLWILA